MEEQRARQETENATSGGAQAGEEGAQAPAAGAADQAAPASATEEDDPVLARALAMSVGESAAAASAEPDLSAMTEDEQIAYAMRMSMQAEEGSSGPAAASEEKMDVDEPSGSSEKKDDDYSEAMNDPAFLQVNNTCAEKYVFLALNIHLSFFFQSVLESLPGVDPQSDAVRQAVGAMSGQSKDSKKKDEDKKDDQAKK